MSLELLSALTPVVEALESLGIPYRIGGSVASSVHGLSRSTNDVDIVADIRPDDVDPLCRLLAERYYAEPTLLAEAVRTGSCTNFLHYATACKIDVFVRRRSPYDGPRPDRRQASRPGTAAVAISDCDPQVPPPTAQDPDSAPAAPHDEGTGAEGHMGLRVNTNVISMNAQRNLARITEALAGNFRRLSTGLRISTAADDAAGLAISERLRSQVRSLEQAQRNANDGISMVQTAEGALSEVNDIMARLRELAVQASNGTVSAADRATLQEEFGSLVAEIDRIAQSTDFNGIELLDGSQASVTFQVGTGTTAGVDTIDVALESARAAALGLDTLDIGATGNPAAAITALDAAIDTVSGLRGRLGAVQNRLGSTIRNVAVQVENLSAAESRIRDVDVAYEAAQLTRNQILQQASIAMLAQANAVPQAALQLLA